LAEQIEAQTKLDMARGGSLAKLPRFQFFEAAAAEFLAWAEDVEHRDKPNTAARLKASFASLVVHFSGRAVASIDGPDVEDYKAWRIREHAIRDVTLRHDLHALSAFYRKWALPRRLAMVNPVMGVKIPSDRDSVREHILTADEEEAYFAQAEGTPVLYDVAKLMLLTGCRPEEVTSLPQCAVDLKARQMTIRGGKSRAAKRTLDLVDEAVWILKRRLRTPGEWVFPSDRKKGAHITKLNSQHDEACREAGVSFVLYDLRHTFATRMLTEVGTDVGTLAKIMGHANLRTLQRYIHPTSEAQKSAMERFQELLAQQRKRRKTGTS
jgi:integrase